MAGDRAAAADRARLLDAVAADPRPKLLALAEHDEFRDPRIGGRGDATTGSRPSIEVVGGASHFFVGRTDRFVEVATGYVDRLTGVS